jgi:dihydropteroate synthase
VGVLNVTPDSFAEAEPITTVDAAARHALDMEEQGADLIDIGGESTRPGARPVPAAEELARVVPVVRALAPRLRIPMSVDTYKADVARAVLAEGAAIINDISALKYDPALGSVVAGSGAGLVLMHMRGRSAAMYAEARYDDIVAEIAAELRDSMQIAARAGVPAERLILDPGIGFAKRPADSYGVLARLPELAAAVERPLLVGPSRKSFMRQALNDRPAIDRDWGTAAAVTAAVLGGAHLVRVHNVQAMTQVVRTAENIRRS